MKKDASLRPLAAGEFKNFKLEASGVTQIENGNILLIGDEKEHAMEIATFRAGALATAERIEIGEDFNDLEGLTRDDAGWFYAITSHGLNKNGKRKADRERLMRFRLRGEKPDAMKTVSGLKEPLLQLDKSFAQAAEEIPDDGGFNIEGMAWNPTDNSLLIGLRAPLVDQKAALLPLTNPTEVFEQEKKAKFAKPVLLDLKGGGIRDLTFDPYLKEFLIISGPVNDDGSFALWRWTGQSSDTPVKMKIDFGKLKRPEGVASLKVDGKPAVLIVSDEGGEEASRYLLLEWK